MMVNMTINMMVAAASTIQSWRLALPKLYLLEQVYWADEI
jgi:hypothetical protein